MNYNKTIRDYVATLPTDTPIFTEHIVKIVSARVDVDASKIKNTVNSNLQKLVVEDTLGYMQKGVYYKPEITPFGKTKPPFERLVTETCIRHDNKRIGYIGGEVLLHDLGLTSSVPKTKVIVTNKHNIKLPNVKHITLKKPAVDITEENVKYLQLIDAMAMLGTEYIDAVQPRSVIKCWFKKFDLDEITTIKIAKSYYPKRVLFEVLDTILDEGLTSTQQLNTF